MALAAAAGQQHLNNLNGFVEIEHGILNYNQSINDMVPK